MKFTGEEQKRMTRGATEDTEAYQLYLQGRYHWNKRTLEDMQQAIDFFGQAIKRDPKYALAYAGQADAYALLADFNVLPTKEVLPKVKSAADMAISLDGSLAEAHASRGWALYHEWDWSGAEKEFKQALDLNPGYAQAHSAYGDYLVALGRFDGALAELNRAHDLDPSSPVASLALGMRSYYARDYPKAIEQCQQTSTAEPLFVPAHVCLGRAYEQKGSYPEAIAELQRALDLSGGDTNELATLGRAYALAGQTKDALKTLTELNTRSQQTYVQPAWIAVIQVAMGDTDQAFGWERGKSFRGPIRFAGVFEGGPRLRPGAQRPQVRRSGQARRAARQLNSRHLLGNLIAITRPILYQIIHHHVSHAPRRF